MKKVTKKALQGKISTTQKQIGWLENQLKSCSSPSETRSLIDKLVSAKTHLIVLEAGVQTLTNPSRE